MKAYLLLASCLALLLCLLRLEEVCRHGIHRVEFQIHGRGVPGSRASLPVEIKRGAHAHSGNLCLTLFGLYTATLVDGPQTASMGHGQSDSARGNGPLPGLL